MQDEEYPEHGEFGRHTAFAREISRDFREGLGQDELDGV